MKVPVTLPTGTKLGPYEILSLIGAGGMGQVYKARDTRLDRVVAIKLLPPDLAERPDRRRRFETEARAISSLGHPNICALFDVGEAEGHPFIVMEYLEGETLDDRLARGALSSAEVLRYGSQIADALDHAHRSQIIHRDLKPSNVMLTASGAKLLDFGLAKAVDTKPPGLGTTASFEQRKLTAEGTVLGTVQYMSPEQLEGRPVDARTDVFAFGMLLYQMATGRKAFDGESQASLIAAILTETPSPISSVRPTNPRDPLPPGLDHVVGRCLAKHPDARWQTARDLKAELEWISSPGSQVGLHGSTSDRGRRVMFVSAIAIAAITAVGVAAWLALRPSPAATDVTRFLITLPRGATLVRGRDVTRLAVSPDRRRLAFVASLGGREQLWVQSFGSLTAQPLEGTDGAMSPFWSPDSRFIGFFTSRAGEIRKIDASGGPPRTICAAVMSGLPVWMQDNTILFSEFRKGIVRVSADGGKPIPVTVIDAAQRELNHYWPSLLPDGRHFLYMVTRLEANGRRGTPIVYVGSLDSPDRREVIRMNSRVVYSPTGHVLYVQEGTLLAQAFDVSRFQLRTEPIRLADSLDYFRSTGAAAFSVSGDVLAHHGESAALELAWFDRSGRRIGTIGTPQRFGNLRISPGGEQVAVEVQDPRLGTSDIWLHHFARGVATRFTSDLNDEITPVWSPDGHQLLFGSDRGTGLDASSDFFLKRLDGTDDEELFFDLLGFQAPEDWSSDGRWVAYSHDNRETGGFDVWRLPFEAKPKPEPLLRNRFDEWGARFSPNAEWVAFVSDESGNFEIYVVPFGRSGVRTMVSSGGGIAPRWRRDGKELFYITADGKSVMSVPVELSPTFKAGTPVRLFTIGTDTGFRGRARNVPYDVLPDGQRFLINVATAEPVSSRITVVLNWPALLQP